MHRRLHDHSGDRGLKDKPVVHDALNVAGEPPGRDLDFFAKQVERVAGNDLAAKCHAIAADETDEFEVPRLFFVENAAQLSASLNHENAWQQGPARNVPAYPELIRPHCLHSQGLAAVAIQPNDMVKLAHIAALWVELANFIAGDGNLTQIDLRNVKEEASRHSGRNIECRVLAAEC